MCWERRRQEHAAERHPPPKARATAQTRNRGRETAESRSRPICDPARRPQDRAAAPKSCIRDRHRKRTRAKNRYFVRTKYEPGIAPPHFRSKQPRNDLSMFGIRSRSHVQITIRRPAAGSGMPRTGLPPTASPLVGDSTTGSAQRTDPAFRLAESPNKIRVVPMQENGRQKRTRLPSRTRCPAVRPEGRRGGKDNCK